MPILLKCCAILLLVTVVASAEEATADRSKVYPQLNQYLEARTTEFDQIPTERKALLNKLTHYVKGRVEAHQPTRITFICTHNSRRSHMSQIWAATAASYYGVANVETFSGGTEGTAFNPRAVAALERAGLKLEMIGVDKNPRYAVSFQATDTPMICFSKVYRDPSNPKADFCAAMTCSQADQNCLDVESAALRVAIPFEDPKVADNTPAEAAQYDERCQQICREIMFVFSQVGQ